MAGGVLVEPSRDPADDLDVAPSRGTRELILVSHRGPVQYEQVDGERVITRGAGGLVSALRDLVRHVDCATWVCAAVSDEDHVVAENGALDANVAPGSTCQ